MLRSSTAIIASLCLGLALAAGAAHSMIINPGFESGLSGWPNAGDVGDVSGAVLGFTPTEGSSMALLSTATAASDFPPFSGSNAINAAFFEIVLGLPFGTIRSPTGVDGTEGSMLGQSFTGTAGETLHFDYNLLSLEPGTANNDDFAFIHLSLANDLSFASILTTPMAPVSGGVYASGWRTASFALPSSGTYQLAIGIFDAFNRSQATALLLDNLRISPEPGTAGLVGLGLLGLGLLGRRRDAPHRRDAGPRETSQAS